MSIRKRNKKMTIQKKNEKKNWKKKQKYFQKKKKKKFSEKNKKQSIVFKNAYFLHPQKRHLAMPSRRVSLTAPKRSKQAKQRARPQWSEE